MKTVSLVQRFDHVLMKLVSCIYFFNKIIPTPRQFFYFNLHTKFFTKTCWDVSTPEPPGGNADNYKFTRRIFKNKTVSMKRTFKKLVKPLISNITWIYKRNKWRNRDVSGPRAPDRTRWPLSAPPFVYRLSRSACSSTSGRSVACRLRSRPPSCTSCRPCRGSWRSSGWRAVGSRAVPIPRRISGGVSPRLSAFLRLCRCCLPIRRPRVSWLACRPCLNCR